MFFVELRTGTPTPPADDAERIRVEVHAALNEAMARGELSSCERGGCDPLEGYFDFLLDENSYLATVHRARHRFFRLKLLDRGEGNQPDVNPCKIVEALRREFAQASNLVPVVQFSVGRECDVTALAGVEPIATDQMMTWHLAKMGRVRPGASISAIDLTNARAPKPNVVIALIDGGVDPGLARELGIEERCVIGRETYCPANDPTQHGSAMALLMRQMTTSAEIRSYQVFNRRGEGGIGDIAIALDRTLLDLGGRDTPLVMNFSLGWPPELSLRSRLEHGPCRTVEDGAGQSVQYLLELAHRERRPTFAVGASGNRRGNYRNLDTYQVAETRFVGCDGARTAGFEPRMFFPATYEHHSCLAGETSPGPVIFPAVAIDAHGHDSVFTMPNMTAPWPYAVAPGQHVYVWSPRWSAATSATRACPTPAGTAFGLRLPAALTGTSVSAALISGTAAEVLSRLRTSHPALAARVSQKNLGALLTNVSSATRPRVLSFGRLQYALDRAGDTYRPGNCFPWLECSISNSSPCPREEEICFDGAEEPAPIAAPRWPSSYPSCAPSRDVSARASVCSAGSCPPPTYDHRSAFGSTGPQPEEPICNECKFTWDGSAGLLVIDISPAFPSNLEISEPTLAIEWIQGGATFMATVDLSDAVRLEPGLSADVEIGDVFSGPNPPNWSEAIAYLKSTVRLGEGQPMTDVSPLHLEVNAP